MENSFITRMKRMLKADFRRMFSSSLLYIFIGIALVIPVLILVMTTMNSSGEGSLGFTNAWQMIGSLPSGGSSSSAGAGMDMSSMMNINMMLFALGVLSCIFVSADFSSGYIKNYLVVRKNRTDYVLSKIIVLTVASFLLYAAFFIGTVLGGKFASLSFAMEGFSAFNIVMSMLSKVLLSTIFISIFVVVSVIGKDKMWLSILLSLALGMILFMMVPMITPLTSTFMNFGLTLAGGVLFSIPLALVGNLILTKFRTV